jgi:DNA-binding transcriptional LysR family regulator
MRIDFLGLQAFLSIAERGSFQRAAAHLNLSQTALSHRMRKFEQDLGVALLTRTTRHVALTPAGNELLPRARRLMEELNESFAQLRTQGTTRQETLAIGCLPTIATHYLPPILKEFIKTHPAVTVRIYDNSALEIAELVQAGTAELGLTIVSTHLRGLDVRPLLREPFVLLCPAGHPFAKQKSLTWAELAGTPLIRVSPQTGNRLLIDDALGSRRESLQWRFEVQHIASAVSLVLAGVGLTVVPRLAIDSAATPGLAEVRLRDPQITRTIGILTRRNASLSPAAADLMTLIRRHIRAPKHARDS